MTDTRDPLDAALLLLCQKIERRVIAVLRFTADPDYPGRQQQLALATDDLNIAARLYDEEVLRRIAEPSVPS